jgi:hypothetical protein
MKDIIDLIHELRCDIHACEVKGTNDTEIKEASATLSKLQELIKNKNIQL